MFWMFSLSKRKTSQPYDIKMTENGKSELWIAISMYTMVCRKKADRKPSQLICIYGDGPGLDHWLHMAGVSIFVGWYQARLALIPKCCAISALITKKYECHMPNAYSDQTLFYVAYLCSVRQTKSIGLISKACRSCSVPNIWAPSSEFVSLSIPSWHILIAHAQPFRVARDLAFCLKVPLDSLLVWASSEGSGETARMRRLAWTFAARIGDKYQIRLTRSILRCNFFKTCMIRVAQTNCLSSAF